MIQLNLQEQLQKAVLSLMPDADVSKILVRPCPEPNFGDYQANALIGLAKRNKLDPRDFAKQVIGKIDVDKFCEIVEVAGPGFLNFRLKTQFISCLLYTSPSPRDRTRSRMPSSA